MNIFLMVFPMVSRWPRGAAEAPPPLCPGGQEPRAPCGAGGAQRMLRPRRAQLVALQRASTAGAEGHGAGAGNGIIMVNMVNMGRLLWLIMMVNMVEDLWNCGFLM